MAAGITEANLARYGRLLQSVQMRLKLAKFIYTRFDSGVVRVKDVNPGQLAALKAIFILYFLVPVGPFLAAHGSPKIQLTFPATRPSRTIPSLKSDIRKTGGGGGERRWIQPDLGSGLKIAGAAPQPRCDASER